jgi:ankyrin repeat protein
MVIKKHIILSGSLFLLLSACAPKGRNLDQQMMQSIVDGNDNKTESLLKMEIKDGDQAAALKRAQLFIACRNGDVEKVTKLLDSGVNVNSADAMGKTALYHACSGGNLEAVKLLLDKGADVNGDEKGHGVLGASKFSWSPLEIACINSSEEIAILLIDRGVNVNDSNGGPLFKASSYRLRKVVEALIKKGANVNARDVNGNTPLIDSTLYIPLSIKNTKKVDDLLIANGADVNAKNNDNVSYADLVSAK